MGITGVAIHDQTYDGAVTGRRWKIYRPFVEDDWRVTPSLTLNLGLAWDMTTPITEVQDRMADYIPSTGQLLIAGQERSEQFGGHQYVLEAHTNPASASPGKSRQRQDCASPRLWHLSRFVLEPGRAGPLAKSAQPRRVRSIPATFRRAAPLPLPTARHLAQTPLPPLTLSGGFPPSYAANVASFTGHLRLPADELSSPAGFTNITPTSNASCPATSCSPRATPVTGGAHPGHRQRPQHQQPLGVAERLRLHTRLPARRRSLLYPYNPPNFNAILLFGDVGKTHYNSMQIKAETKTPKNGLYALVAYTYSQTYDNGLSDGLGSELSAPYFPLPNWQKLDWSLSQINLDQSFTGSVIYDLPFGNGKEVRQRLESRDQRASRRLAGHADRKGLFRVSPFR